MSPSERAFIARNKASQGRLVRLLDRLTDSDLGRVVDGWTVGTNLAHLAFWDRFLLVRWEEAAASGRATPLDVGEPLFDLINEALAVQWALLDLASVRVLVLGAAEALDTHLAALPADAIAAAHAAGLTRMLDRSLHREGHIAPIETALFG